MLAAYDAQARMATGALPPDVVLDWDGPLLRLTGGHEGFVIHRDLDGLTGRDIDALIRRTIEHYRAAGQAVEWKTHAHDEPADLPERLVAAGFVADDEETVVVAPVDAVIDDPVLPEGVAIRSVHTIEDLRRLAAMESEVWGTDEAWRADALAGRLAVEGNDLVVLMAEAADEVVSAAWLVVNAGTEFAGLWGGSTLAAWRGRGIYRALVARRAQLAHERGVGYLQVDASEDSRPILERLGFTPITTTTPYRWTP